VGIGQTARLEVEPEIPNSSCVPEAHSAGFFGTLSYVEVTTATDGKLSGEADMQRATQKMVEFANSVRRKCGKNLYSRSLKEITGKEAGIFARTISRRTLS